MNADISRRPLLEAVAALADDAKRLLARDRRPNEQDTKAVLIEPMLRALGWDTHDTDEVHREFRANSKDAPVDYALKLMHKPELFVEAKSLGVDLTERSIMAQLLKYAAVGGVEWCVLSNGDRYQIFNATVKARADEKLFRQASLSSDAPEHVAATLGLISRENMLGKKIDTIWQTEFVDRKVRSTLTDLVSHRDARLLRLIVARSKGLKPKQVADSLQRVKVCFAGLNARESDTVELAGPMEASHRATPDDAENRRLAVSLQDLIRSGVLRSQQKLFANYRKQRFEATLMLNGTIVFAGSEYPSCSAAGEAVKCKLSNRKKMATDGWRFWRFIDETGQERTLADARQKLIDGETAE